jgi:transcriptional regulator with XRE-family HTH domain
MRNKRRQRLAKAAIDGPRKTLDELAQLYGISRYTLTKYRLGTRSPNRTNLTKLSEGLRIYARQILFLREQIEQELRNGDN